jgi:hypothetical protein
MLLWAVPLVPSFNLAGFGAPTCELRVSPSLAFPTMVTDPGQSFGSGAANIELQVPAHAGLLGGTLYVQWVNLERSLPPPSWSNAGGITTSSLVAATLSSTPATLGMATIASAPLPAGWTLPATGSTHTASAPVLRFEYR